MADPQREKYRLLTGQYLAEVFQESAEEIDFNYAEYADAYSQEMYGAEDLSEERLFERVGDDFDLLRQVTELSLAQSAQGIDAATGFASAREQLRDHPAWNPRREADVRSYLERRQRALEEDQLRMRTAIEDGLTELDVSGFRGLANKLRDLGAQAGPAHGQGGGLPRASPRSLAQHAQLRMDEVRARQQREAAVRDYLHRVGQIAGVYENWARHRETVHWRQAEDLAGEIAAQARALDLDEADLRSWLEVHRLNDWREPLPRKQFLDPVTDAAGAHLARFAGQDRHFDQ